MKGRLESGWTMWSTHLSYAPEQALSSVNQHPSFRLPAEKRAVLFRVASVEFAANGFTKASLNRIIAELNMSKSSFYHYFKNKADLFEQTLLNVISPLFAKRHSLEMEGLTSESYWHRIQMLTLELNEMVSASPEMVSVGRMIYRSMESPNERILVAKYIADLNTWIVALLKRGQSLGQVRADLPESFLIETVMALAMSIDRWMLAHWADFSDAERLQLNEKIMGLFMRVLAPL